MDSAGMCAHDARELRNRKNMASPASNTAADETLPTDIAHSHEALNTTKRMKTSHRVGKESLVCSLCFKTFTSNESLQRHSPARCKHLHKEVTSREMFICDQCSKSFCSKTDVDLHSTAEQGYQQTSYSCYQRPGVLDDVSAQHTDHNCHMSQSNGKDSNSFSLNDEREQDCYDVYEPRYLCHVCGVTLAHECVLAEHLLVAHYIYDLSTDWEPFSSPHRADVSASEGDNGDAVNDSYLLPKGLDDISSQQTDRNSDISQSNVQDSNSISSNDEREQDCYDVYEPRYLCHVCGVTLAHECVLAEHLLVAHYIYDLSTDWEPFSSTHRADVSASEGDNGDAVNDSYLLPKGLDDISSQQTDRNSDISQSNVQDSNSISSNDEREQDCYDVYEPRYLCHVCGVTLAHECVLAEHLLVAHYIYDLSTDWEPFSSPHRTDVSASEGDNGYA